jgi:acetyl-CoA acetyltransferase
MAVATIIGIDEMRPVARPLERSSSDLMMEVAAGAIRDAGLEHGDVDGLITIQPIGSGMYYPHSLIEILGIRSSYCNILDLGGASATGMVFEAAMAIQAGLCNTVLCLVAEAEDPRKFYSWMPPSPIEASFEFPYGKAHAHSGFAMFAKRHMYEFGTTSKQMAKIAVDQRTNACANPNALFYDRPITIEDVLNSRVICDPIHLLDTYRGCSGAAAYIVTSAERGRRAKRAVQVLGMGEKVTHRLVNCAPSLTTTPIKQSAAQSFKMAGLTPADVDLVCAYDCYTITVLITLEDAGFCPKGQGGHFVEEHDLTYKGDFPTNTHGGQLSFGNPSAAGGASHVIEAVRQLRGEAGERQVADCAIAWVNGNGGIFGSEVSLVFEREN